MRNIVNFFKGILFGIAVVIPGLSGSAFLVVLGLYEQVIESVANLKKKFISNFLFLLPVGLGGVVGVFISTKIVLTLCQRFRVPAYLFFIVLVLTAFPDVLKKMKKRKINLNMILLVFGGLAFVIAMGTFSQWLQSYASSEIDTYVAIPQIRNIYDCIIVVFSGALSCGLMTVPGVSGSVILMLIGQYGTVYSGVANFNLPIIALFALGSIIGVMSCSKILSRILAKFEYELYYVVMGLLIGCIITLFVCGVLNIQFI